MIGWGHDDLTSYMKAAGYESDEGGVCFGYSHMGMQAILSQGMKEFDDRIVHMQQDKIDAKSKDDPVKIRDRGLQGITPFLDGVELYYQSKLYPDLFEPGKVPNQKKPLETAPLVMSTKIREEGGLNQCANFVGIYNNEELTQYLAILQDALTKTNPPNTKPLALTLGNDEHSITVGFDPTRDPKEGQWIYIDASNMPTKYLKSPQEIAAAVQQGFKASDDKVVFFTTKIYSTNKNKEHSDKIIGTCQANPAWAELHQVNKENKDNKHLSSLLRALVIDGRTEDVKALLKNPNIDPNTSTEKGFTPLTIAAFENSEIVKDLLKHPNINPNQARSYEDGYTALHIATILGKGEITKELLNHGAYPDKRDSNGKTPLDYAVSNNNQELVGLLLKHGADIDLESLDDNVPTAIKDMIEKQHKILDAINDGKLDLVKELLTENKDKSEDSVLHLAVKAENLAVVKALLHSGLDIDVNSTNKRKDTPLHYAANKGNPSIVQVLLKEGANPSLRNGSGTTPRELGADNAEIEAVFVKHDDKKAKKEAEHEEVFKADPKRGLFQSFKQADTNPLKLKEAVKPQAQRDEQPVKDKSHSRTKFF